MRAERYADEVALVTGGAAGIGAAIARRLAAGGAKVVVADVDVERGQVVADEIGGLFTRCDVRDRADSEAAVRTTTALFGGLDSVVLNAGVVTGGAPGDFDPERYRRVMSTNVDGVVYGVLAALPVLKGQGRGAIVVNASLGGLVAMPFDPVYAASKAAVVNYVRSLAPLVAADGVRINALCPSFTDTTVIDGFRPVLDELGLPVLGVEEVVDVFESALRSPGTGEAWYVQRGWPGERFPFAAPPEPRALDSSDVADRTA